MKASHTRGAVRARFDDPSLVSCAGLVPMMRLAQDAGLHELAEQHVKVPGPAGANAAAKIGSIVAGMAAGADSIDDLDVVRHGAMPRLFTGIRAPSTLGTFLRGLCHGDVRSVHAIHTRFLQSLADRTPLLPGADALVFLDIDAKKKQVHGHQRDGARRAYTGALSLDYLMVTMTGPLFAPVILTARLRDGAAHSCRGATAEIAQTGFTAFTNATQHPDGPVAAGLVVRRIPDTRRNTNNNDGQHELFTAWRYQAVFTDTGFEPADSERYHRGRARIEQVVPYRV